VADDAAYLAQRAAELAEHVLAPLVLGGPLSPVRPFGAKLALAIGDRGIEDADLRSRIDVARVRRARLTAPVDTLPDIDAPQWALAAALNDLVQVTNHELASGLTRGRHVRLLASVRDLCERIPAPRDLLSVLSRHATFATVLEVTRTDTLVRWWTGRATFRGQPPAQRLLRWKELRRVSIERRPVRFGDMCEGLEVVRADEFAEVLGLWLTRSPLTDLATATRKKPLFGWSASTLSLLATTSGRTLAWRVLSRQPSAQVSAMLARSSRELPEQFKHARQLAESFEREVAEGLKARTGAA
jgi:hypothetical protein